MSRAHVSGFDANLFLQRGKIGVRAAVKNSDAFVFGRSIGAARERRPCRRAAGLGDQIKVSPESALRRANRFVGHKNDAIEMALTDRKIQFPDASRAERIAGYRVYGDVDGPSCLEGRM